MYGEHGVLELSIYELGQPPRFRLTATLPGTVERVIVETRRERDERQCFTLARRGEYWESLDSIPEPHAFEVTVTVSHTDHAHTYRTAFAEHEHHHEEPDSDRAVARKVSSRTALLLILGSSPMVEGIPAFFAAGKYGASLILIMALVFAASTIVTYVGLCVYSTIHLQRMKFDAFERYGEVISGAFIVVVGLAFWVFPVL
jgi:ABC-type nickel/cobalt efflux system permease component RcnA